MDIWQIPAGGGEPQRLTWHNSRVSFPTLLDERTLLYLATSADGSGPWIHALDLENRTTHRVKSASNAYTSLAATADGRRLVVTESHPTASLWSVRLTDGIAGPERRHSDSHSHAARRFAEARTRLASVSSAEGGNGRALEARRIGGRARAVERPGRPCHRWTRAERRRSASRIHRAESRQDVALPDELGRQWRA